MTPKPDYKKKEPEKKKKKKIPSYLAFDLLGLDPFGAQPLSRFVLKRQTNRPSEKSLPIATSFAAKRSGSVAFVSGRTQGVSSSGPK